jgi:D-alanine transaminase/branched-chain amino acid aminotransferase
MTNYYSINGKLLPANEASVNIDDISILRGYGLFDFFLVKDGHPLFVDDYLERFEYSARTLRLDGGFTRKSLISQIYELIEANGEKDCSIRLVLTGGYSPDGYTPAQPNLLILKHKAFPYPEAQFKTGIKLITAEYQRVLPTVKTTNYVLGIYMLPQIKEAGALDVLYYNQGIISETTRANFFIVKKNGSIVTAGEGILKGITRKQVLTGAAGQFKIIERGIETQELKDAEEAFITSTTNRIMPVVQIDNQLIGNGVPGPVTEVLLQIYKLKEEMYLNQKAGVSL